jgi:hypothetical protein
VSFELAFLIYQIPGFEEVSKKKILDIQMILCEIKGTTFLSEKWMD